MTDKPIDPREAVLKKIVEDAAKALLDEALTGVGAMPYSLPGALARLDAADPLRQMMGEVVEGLEQIGTWSDELNERAKYDHQMALIMWRGCVGHALDLLARLQTLTGDENP